MVMGPVAVDALVSGSELALGKLGTVPGIVIDVAAVRGGLGRFTRPGGRGGPSALLGAS